MEDLQVILEQLNAFHQKYGRTPGPDEPAREISDTDPPMPMSVESLNLELKLAARQAGVDISHIPDDQLFDAVVRALKF